VVEHQVRENRIRNTYGICHEKKDVDTVLNPQTNPEPWPTAFRQRSLHSREPGRAAAQIHLVGFEGGMKQDVTTRTSRNGKIAAEKITTSAVAAAMAAPYEQR
jgi:hypothetical protein